MKVEVNQSKIDIILTLSLPICQVHRLGRVAFEEAWGLQDLWAGEIEHGERLASLKEHLQPSPSMSRVIAEVQMPSA